MYTYWMTGNMGNHKAIMRTYKMQSGIEDKYFDVHLSSSSAGDIGE